MKIKSTIDQIVDYVTEEIYSGRISPGSRIKEQEISEWLGVSRTPIREAFRILESKGLAESISNKGVRVPVVTLEDLEEVCEVRTIMEVYCVKKLINMIDENDIQEMENILKEMEKAANEQDYRFYFEHAINFHAYYVRKCQNKRLYYAFSVMRNTIQCSQLLLRKNPKSFGESIDEHKGILLALRKRDIDKCEELVRQHLRNSCDRMINVWYKIPKRI